MKNKLVLIGLMMGLGVVQAYGQSWENDYWQAYNTNYSLLCKLQDDKTVAVMSAKISFLVELAGSYMRAGNKQKASQLLTECHQLLYSAYKQIAIDTDEGWINNIDALAIGDLDQAISIIEYRSNLSNTSILNH